MSTVKPAQTPAQVTRENLSATVEALREDNGLDDRHGRIAVIGGVDHVIFLDKVVPMETNGEDYDVVPEDAEIQQGELSAHARMVNLAKAFVVNQISYDYCIAAMNFAAMLDEDTMTFKDDGVVDIDAEEVRYKAIFDEIGESEFLERPVSIEDILRMLSGM